MKPYNNYSESKPHAFEFIFYTETYYFETTTTISKKLLFFLNQQFLLNWVLYNMNKNLIILYSRKSLYFPTDVYRCIMFIACLRL